MLLRVLIITFFTATTAFSQIPAIEPGVSHDLAIWRAAHYSDVRYKLDLTLEKMSPVLKGTIEIRLKVSEPPASAGGQNASPNPTPIVLDWRKIRGSEQLSTISNVSLNGNLLSVSSNWPPADTGGSDSEHLIFRDGVVAGENVIKLDFTSPILTSGSAITRYVDREDGAEYIYSLFVPSDASTAFPVFDQPDLKARFTLSMRTDGTLSNSKVISNEMSDGMSVFGGTFEGQDVKPSVVYRFKETKPISTYVFAFAAGPFANFREDLKDFLVTRDNLPVDPVERKQFLASLEIPKGQNPSFIYVRKSQAEKFKPHAAEVFRLEREDIKYLESYFDYKFPFPKYDLVLIPEFPFGGMEHAGATFLREASVIFPTEPTKNDQISRANLIFHETAHQWFGDTVTMKWFDDLWLKEGFAEFMAYKTLEKVMPEANAWKVFYERNKEAAYLTDSTRGTTPIYQEIANLSAAKSAYGNIVYRKAPSFLRQAEFYLGEDKFQTAVRAFLKKHEFANAGWEDLVKEFEGASGQGLKQWADAWIRRPGVPVIRSQPSVSSFAEGAPVRPEWELCCVLEQSVMPPWPVAFSVQVKPKVGLPRLYRVGFSNDYRLAESPDGNLFQGNPDVHKPAIFFPNYGDYGYGIFLLDDKSRDYVLKNIQNEKDDFLRTMMWGSLWDSVREAELAPKDYVELVIRNLSGQDAQARASARAISDRSPRETDEGTIQTLLGRVSTAMNYYMSEPPASAGGQKRAQDPANWPAANAAGSDLRTRLESLLIDKIQNAPTLGQRITYYRAFLNIASTERARNVLKQILKNGSGTNMSVPGTVVTGAVKKAPLATAPGTDTRTQLPLKAKDRFDIVTRLIILGDPEGPALLAALEKTETSDDAKRYAYAAKAGVATAESKAKFWTGFTTNKDISESWIEAAFGPFNSVRHNDLTLPYLEKALAELPNLKRNRKIFFVNGWLGAFIGGQRSEAALAIVNKFLADNPNLDKDLRLKILENVDLIERAVKIRTKFGTR